MNALNSYRLENKLTFEALALITGNDKTSIFRHCHGKKIKPEDAVMYETTLGIPRHQLRPDLWPLPQQESSANHAA